MRFGKYEELVNQILFGKSIQQLQYSMEMVGTLDPVFKDATKNDVLFMVRSWLLVVRAQALPPDFLGRTSRARAVTTVAMQYLSGTAVSRTDNAQSFQGIKPR